MRSREPRLFTLEMANAALPLVRRIVGDLLELYPRWRDAVAAYEAAQHDATADGESEHAREARVLAGGLAGEIESCLDELDQVGCHYKGFETGLVDFPALHEGRTVYLCWEYNELDVRYWHELSGGYAGRRPVDRSFLTADAR